MIELVLQLFGPHAGAAMAGLSVCFECTTADTSTSCLQSDANSHIDPTHTPYAVRCCLVIGHMVLLLFLMTHLSLHLFPQLEELSTSMYPFLFGHKLWVKIAWFQCFSMSILNMSAFRQKLHLAENQDLPKTSGP